ncbi:MAG: lytic murein transglycosylase B [Proteobacteria bacterium]|nr:lytic murein transglycosylase B [Pseudomonadota bacterium]MDA1298496.1 lytic murein transglycosylase B [Pseudomonadota bacterium]
MRAVVSDVLPDVTSGGEPRVVPFVGLTIAGAVAKALSRLVAMATLLFVPVAGAEDRHADRDYADRKEVRAFVSELALDTSFTEAGLLTVFKQAEYQQSIIDAISRPAEKTMMWDEYQDIFLTERRIGSGREFMMQYQDALVRAERAYGVPPVIVAAVIGVETMYGRYRGRYRVLDALTTLAFDYPPRASFFRRELKEFILLAREEKQLITDLKGSYAGAMGYGQFISSSYRRYAVDFDGDDVRDIWENPVDAIGSVANYLAEHGWVREDAIAVRIDPGQADMTSFNVSLKPTSTLGVFQSAGVNVSGAADREVSPMRLQGKEGDEYWLGFTNFYVITRYNHSKLYAMAVFQLSEALRHPDTLVGQFRQH